MCPKRSDDNEPKAKKPTRGVESAIRFKTRFGSSSYRAAVKSGKAESVIKVISQSRGSRVKALMEYVARENDDKKESLEIEDELGALHGGKAEIEEIYKTWKNDFEQGKPGSKRPPRHATHLMLSGTCEHNDENAKKVLAAARETVKELIDKKGHDYVLALHRDGAKPHVHVVIKNSNREADGVKLRLNPPELLEMRQLFAEKLQELGLEQTATLRKDRVAILEQVAKNTEQLKKNDTIYESELRKSSPSVDTFKHKKNVARAIVRTRANVYSLPPGNERAEHLKALRELETKLKKKDVDINLEVKATANKLGKDTTKFLKQIEEYKEQGKPISNKEMLRQRKTITTLQKRVNRDIQAGIDAIKKSKASPAEKKQAVKELKQHQKQVDKALGRSRER